MAETRHSANEGTNMDVVNLAEKFSLFSDYYKPRIVGELNDSYVKVVKLKGEFVWHHHENEDELFWVVKGRLLMRLRDREVWINPGEFFIVPKGVEHLPIAEEETHVVLLEPKSTLNTGNVRNERTVEHLARI
jgi:mannose-6-phosphate isomerase-like protein (cupin superfamily)